MAIDDVTVPGWNFDAWPAGSMVTLVNVPWSNTYRDVVRFNSREDLNAYIDSQVTEQADIRTNMSYVPTNRPIRLADPENRLYRYNYLRVSNPTIPGTNDRKKDYYYFITSVEFVNGGTSLITVQLDVFQTFMYDVNFGTCYVERGHVGIANENMFDQWGRTYLTVPEGIDTGSNYVISQTHREMIISPSLQDYNDYLVCSVVDLTADPFDSEGFPTVETAKGGRIQSVWSGASYYIVRGPNFTDFVTALSKYPWVAQGIISVSVIPRVQRYDDTFDYTVVDQTLHLTEVPEGVLPPRKYNIYSGSADWRQDLMNSLPERYRHLWKFTTHPYCSVQLTTNLGTPLDLRPESWANTHLMVSEHVSLPLPSQRIGIYPIGYNDADQDSLSEGEEYDRATMVSNLPQVAIVNDAAALALANQTHSLAYSRSSADWSQQKALRGNALSYDQATSAINLSSDVLNQQQATERQNLANQNQWAQDDAFRKTITNTAGAAIGGAAVGGIAGAAVGAIGGLGSGLMGQWDASINANRATETLGINQRSAQSINRMQSQQQGYVRDTNRSLSDWAAKGDYENTIAGINAKVQDTEMTPPSVAGQVGGEMFNLTRDVGGGVSGQEIIARVRRVDDAHVRMIGDYWLRYGYAVNRFMNIDGLKVMSKFSYWKMSETYITTGPMPETYKQAIRGIFEKGVTVWSDPDDIGNIDIADNEPLEGISY